MTISRRLTVATGRVMAANRVLIARPIAACVLRVVAMATAMGTSRVLIARPIAACVLRVVVMATAMGTNRVRPAPMTVLSARSAATTTARLAKPVPCAQRIVSNVPNWYSGPIGAPRPAPRAMLYSTVENGVLNRILAVPKLFQLLDSGFLPP